MYKEMSVDADEVMADLVGDSRSQAESVEGKGMPNILSGILQHFVLPYTSARIWFTIWIVIFEFLHWSRNIIFMALCGLLLLLIIRTVSFPLKRLNIGSGPTRKSVCITKRSHLIDKVEERIYAEKKGRNIHQKRVSCMLKMRLFFNRNNLFWQKHGHGNGFGFCYLWLLVWVWCRIWFALCSLRKYCQFMYVCMRVYPCNIMNIDLLQWLELLDFNASLPSFFVPIGVFIWVGYIESYKYFTDYDVEYIIILFSCDISIYVEA